MKKISYIGLLFLAVQCMSGQLNSKLQAYVKDVTYNKLKQPTFISLTEAKPIEEAAVAGFINSVVFGNSANQVIALKTEKDSYGYTHTRYTIAQNGITLYNKIIVAHCKNGVLSTLNGDLRVFEKPSNVFSLSENAALALALKKVNASRYKWENKAEEEQMRKALGQPGFSYYPAGEKTIYEKAGKLYNAFKFTIYAEKPLSRANVFVDAATGKILGEQNLICSTNVPGTAITKYSGTQTLTCDNNSGTYRLRENQRGLGVETYNVKNTVLYSSAIDFTSASTSWTTTGFDQAATDAHWGAETTYDFYHAKFNINSINNAGLKLVSYVHFDSAFTNAFWDGTRMTYGDGDGINTDIFTALDVCGHEITHGLVSHTAGLGGSGTDECDALNEGFADIFGTSIERFGRPNSWNWLIAENVSINGSGFRNMQNPNSLNQPDTYMGFLWDTNGEPHNNNGPAIFWFYLLVNGGSGTNDNGAAYNVTGLGNVDAEKIAYRALTTYFVPNTDYSDARIAAVQAAVDLFGPCSIQVAQTANAWYAVGVGGVNNNVTIGPNFKSTSTSLCSLPATVNFSNTSASATAYVWDFGDGTGSSLTDPSHVYQANGTYNVKLKAMGCASNVDSIIKNAYVVIDIPSTPIAPDVSGCGNNLQLTMTATGDASLSWYDSPGSLPALGNGNSFTTPSISSTTTYYVVNTVTNTPAYGGIVNYTGSSAGYLADPSKYLVFDVLQNSTLNSVVVYAQMAGTRDFEMRDQFGNLWYTTSVLLTQGANQVPLGFALTPGTGFQLGINFNSTASLMRSTANLNFPYAVGNSVNITGSNDGNGKYYWFYNWSVTKENCSSPAVAVTASVTPGTAVFISAPVTEVCSDGPLVDLSGTPSGGSFSGPGVSGAQFNPSGAGSGSATVIYTFIDENNCVNSDNLVMDVSICTGLSALSSSDVSLTVYPNPFRNRLSIKSSSADATGATVTDASGRIVFYQRLGLGEQELELSGLAKGLYLLNIQSDRGRMIKQIKVVKE